MLRGEQEVEQEDSAYSAGRTRRCLFSINEKPAPKYWQDPRWEDYRSLGFSGKKYEADQLSRRIRADWGLS